MLTTKARLNLPKVAWTKRAHKNWAHLAQIDYTFVTEDLDKLLGSQSKPRAHPHIVLALRNFSRPIKAIKTRLEGLDSTLQMLHHHYKDRINVEKITH
jgi:hypothetical protein